MRLVKSFSYRNVPREFSNRYFIGLNYPTDSARWDALLHAVSSQERTIYPPAVNGGASIIRGYGYKPGSDVPVYETVLTDDGLLDHSTWIRSPGDCAAVAVYTTPDRSKKNHPIYLYSYWHAVGTDTTSPGDGVAQGQHVAMQAYAQHWITGFSDGVTTYHRSRPSAGTLATGVTVNGLITHRDLIR